MTNYVLHLCVCLCIRICIKFSSSFLGSPSKSMAASDGMRGKGGLLSPGRDGQFPPPAHFPFLAVLMAILNKARVPASLWPGAVL